jgi:fucose permease
LAVGFLGTFLFALFPVYAIALVSLFLIGCCLAAAQVNLMPLLRVAVGGENLAFYTIFVTLLFGLGSFISPYIYSYFVNHLYDHATNQNIVLHFLERQLSEVTKWVAVYWVSSAALLLTLIVIFFIRFPKIRLEENEKTGTRSSYIKLLKDKRVVLFFLAIFFYVFCEQGAANWISQFLKTYHDVPPQTTGAFTLSNYWILLTVGCLLGMFLVKFFDSRRIMSVAASLALVALFTALIGGKNVSIVAFSLIGLFISVLWPISMEIAFNSINYHHGSFSGILFTGTIGGAIGPLLVGTAGDYLGLRFGMMLLSFPLLYLLFISVWTKPTIKNKTVHIKAKNTFSTNQII